MKSRAEPRKAELVRAGDTIPHVLAQLATASAATSSRPAEAATPVPSTDPAAAAGDDAGRYEGHLAEFPVFILDKRRRSVASDEPLIYTDTIKGPGNEIIPRRWEAWPGRFGLGGPSTAELFYELVQIYVEQGASADHIGFRTLYSLFRRLHPGAPKPDRKDYARLRRDLDILCSYRFVCENAFYDRARKAYVHMREWSLFTGWTGYTRTPVSGGDYPHQEELPFGAVGVSPVLRTIAKNRGLFSIGFESRLFRRLKPHEQRLAVYLAKMFVSQSTHRRYVDELAAALPIQVAQPKHFRFTVKRAAEGLLRARVPILKSFAFEQAADGRCLVVFHRAERPRQDYRIAPAVAELAPAIAILVDEVVSFTSSPQSRPWFSHCVTTLGTETARYHFSQLKETCSLRPVQNRGALMTKIFEDAAALAKKEL